MEKILFLVLLVFSTLGISGCGGSGFSAKQVSFNYKNVNDDAYTDQIPDQTISERNTKYGFADDPCTKYGEAVAGLYEITNNSKKYMVDTPVLVTLLDSNGNEVPGYYRIMFVTMGPKSTSYAAFEDSVDNFFKLGTRGSWEPTGEQRDSANVDRCIIKPDAPEHVKDASGVHIEILSTDNAPEAVKANVSGDIDTKVQDTYKDEPVRNVQGGGSGISQEWLYNTDISFEDVKGAYTILDTVDDVVNLSGSASATAFNQWGEDIQSMLSPILFIAKEGKQVAGYGIGIFYNRNGLQAGKSGTKVDIKELQGLYVATSNKTEDLSTALYVPVLTNYPLFSNDAYNPSSKR